MGATVLVVFTEDVRWLRFAVILGLWSALIAAFAMAWSRHDARTAHLRAEEIERIYQLELHREISARREYEVGVSEAARQDAENRHREELTGLREQLDRLNDTLTELLNGDPASPPSGIPVADVAGAPGRPDRTPGHRRRAES